MPTPAPPDPFVADGLSRHLAAFDAALLGELPEDLVRDELNELGLDPSRLLLPTAAAARAARPATPDRAPRAPSRGRAPRWRTGVLAALGLLALVMASVAVLRSTQPEAMPVEGEMKSSEPSIPSAGPAPALALEASRARLAAVASTPSDTAGVGVAISEVRRAYHESLRFEQVAGVPIDSALASTHLARLLHDAYLALGQPDSAARYQP